MYGYFRTHCFNFAALAGLCFALFSVSSVAQQLPPGQSVSVDWSPTTSHWQTNGSTFRTPPGTTTTSSSTSVGPVTRTPTGGAAQPMGSGITITSIERTAPISSILRTGPAALRTAVIRCFGNPLCTLGITGATLGLQELLDRFDWSIDDDGSVITENSEYPDEPPYSVSTIQNASFIIGDYCGSRAVCGASRPNNIFIGCSLNIGSGAQSQKLQAYTGLTQLSDLCYYTNDPSYPGPTTWTETVPSMDIEQGVNDSYDFDPSDWPVIGPNIPLNASDVDIEITNSPTLTTPPKTTTVFDSAGNPHSVTETNTEISFSPRPGTNPGKQPSIDIEETTTTTTSDSNGQTTGSSTTTTTRPAGDTTPSESDQKIRVEFPVFCTWAVTVCEWFNWTQEGWDQEEPDLPQIIDFAPEGDFQVGGPGDCPAPYNINLGWMLNTTLEVSYQPFCDFAGLVKPLFLAFCYLFAGVITVRSL